MIDKGKIIVYIRCKVKNLDRRGMKIEDRIQLSELLAEYGMLLTEKQRDVTRLYCDCDMSFGEVSMEYGISRQAVLDILKRAASQLEHYEEVLGNLKLKTALAKVLASVRDGDNVEENLNLMEKLLEE